MKKFINAISFLLTAAIFLPTVSYAEDFIDAESVSDNVSSVISYSTDKIKNTFSNMFTGSAEAAVEAETKKTEFIDPGKELSKNDIQALYDMGYELTEIEEAVSLSASLDKTPYELLQMKGMKKYIPNEITTEKSAKSSATRSYHFSF